MLQSHRSVRRFARVCVVSGLALAGLTCRDNTLTGPGLSLPARLGLAPQFQTMPPGGPVFQLTQLRAVLYTSVTPPESLVVLANFQGDSAVVQFDVEVQGASQLFTVRMAAMDALGDTIYTVTDTVRAYPLGSPGATGAASLNLVYAAP